MPASHTIDYQTEGYLKLDFSGALHNATDSKSKKYFARFVRAGQIMGHNKKPSGITLDPEALNLAALAGKFDNKAVFMDHAGFFDHPSLSRLIGTTSNTAYNIADQSIQGEIRLFETPVGDIAEKVIEELLSNPGNSPDVGLSLTFYPIWNKEHETITGINHVESVDLVFQPAADGRILHMLSTAFQQSPVGAQGLRPDSQPQSQPERKQKMKETTATETTTPETKPQPEPVHADPNVLSAWIDETAKTATNAILAASNLPPASKERLTQGKYNHPDQLNKAIEDERAYLAKLSQDSVIDIGGLAPRSTQITGMSTPLDKLQLALEAMLAGVRPPTGVQPLHGIKELYHLLSGDYEMSGIFQGERILQFANVNSSTMASMCANALNKIVMAEFQQYPKWWEPFATMVDFDTLQAVRWSVLGGVGELPTVAEGAAYTELTWDDKYETNAFIKKGGYLGLTMEAIDKDDTSRLRNAPRALAQAAWLTLSKSISGIFTQAAGLGPNLIDGVALFNLATHANLGTTALSLTAYTAIRLAMRKQTELNSGERLGALCAPKYLLVPPDLEITALQILGSDRDYVYALANAQAAPVNVHSQEGSDLQARMDFARKRVIVVDQWTDTNDYAAVADPLLYPSIGVGFRYGRQPEVFSVASPTAGLMFTNDTLPIKVRFVYAAGPIDYRGLYKMNV